MFVLIYIHSIFSKQPANCLKDIENLWPKDGVLRIEIIANAPKNYTIEDSYEKEYGPFEPQKLEMNETSDPAEELSSLFQFLPNNSTSEQTTPVEVSTTHSYNSHFGSFILMQQKSLSSY